MTDVTAFVGAAGGAGTTRLTVEAAATLARDGRSVAVLDAAYATQGLADLVEGRIDPDVTALVTDDRPFTDGRYPLSAETTADVVCCPAAAPFARLAEAKTPAAPRAFERLVDTAAGAYDAVLLDVPPVAANQAVAAATCADRVAVVTPGDGRGPDALARTRDRLADIGVDVDCTVATRTTEPGPADVAVPESDVDAPGEVPVCDKADGAFVAGVADAAVAALDVTLDRTFDTGLLSL